MAPSVLFLQAPGVPDEGVVLPKLTPGRTVWTSDGFSGSSVGDIDGRATDAVLGGTPQTWAATPAAAIAKTQQLERGSNNAAASAGFAVPFADLRVDFLVTALPSTNAYLDARKSAPEGTGGLTSFRLRWTSGGVMELLYRAGSGTVISGQVGYEVGDRIGLDCFGDQISIVKNGVLAATVTDARAAAAGRIEYVVGSSATLFVDNLIVWRY